MCTVSWEFCRGAPGYDLWFNRDESRKRMLALPPAIHRSGRGSRYLAPTDPEGGGTWIATGTDGTTTAVLNYYDASPPNAPAHPKSRGELVTALASGSCSSSEIDPSAYRPFHLLRVGLDGSARLLTWDGSTFEARSAPVPLSTSSFNASEVLAFRENAFARCRTLEEFHRFHDPEQPASSPLMARADARTVSVTHVVARPECVTYHYFETGGPIDRLPATPSTSVSLK